MLTVTDVVEFEFCHKFTYFTKVLGLRQYEEKRGTVKSGKILHETHEHSNRNYAFGYENGRKLTGIMFYSKNLDLCGKIDEAIELPDEVILVERKYSDNYEFHETLKVQLGLLSLLVEENTKKLVRHATVIFSKEHRKAINFEIDSNVKKHALESLENTKRVISCTAIPESSFDNRCLNCCFRKICPTGSLNNIG